MSNEQIIEGNKLIAQFLGAAWQDGVWRYSRDLNIRTFLDNSDMLLFDSDWNWLMPVVEKIEATKDNQGYGNQFRIWCNSCEIEQANNCYPTVPLIIAATKIESVWLAAVRFVKWHNAQPSFSPSHV